MPIIRARRSKERAVLCRFHIPHESGLTGLPWPAGKIDDWAIAAGHLFGGFTCVTQEAEGRWRNPRLPAEAALIPDSISIHEIAVPLERVPALREFAFFTCVEFEQEVLFFVVDGVPEFLANPLRWPPG